MTNATENKKPTAPTWDIESVFPGGSKSEKFKKYFNEVKTDLKECKKLLDTLPETIDDSSVAAWEKTVLALQDNLEKLELCLAFTGCLVSQNVDDTEALSLDAAGNELYSEWEKLNSILQAKTLNQSDKQWELLLSREKLSGITFYLNELREIAKSKMPIEMETLALDLAVNGFHAWNRLYDKMAGDLKVEFEEKGETKTLSLGQLATKMSDPDRSIRAQAFKKMTESWETREELAGMTLNAIGGFRLSLIKNRKWESPLYEPLVMSRMKQKSLDTMWNVVEQESQKLLPYVEAKKKLLKIDKYMWYDEFSPVGKADKLYSFEEAGEFIIKNIRPFSEDMADFVKMALEKRWVEGEDRAGKRGGAFCTSLGPLRQSRVFMTYSGTYENLLTLAHELGHAYHGWVLRKKPYYATDYPMNLAETASIFSETLVTDAALKEVSDPQEKLMLLEQKIQAAYVMFTDLYSRYLFDKSFYEARKENTVSSKQLRELMVTAQKKAYGKLLDESGYHPLFWCSKLHFYLSGQPFYNFPYTFGFLFSGGVYDRAKKEGASFANKYSELLADTGSMSTEDVAQKHLGVDLTKEDFWLDAVTRSMADIDEFVKLANQLS